MPVYEALLHEALARGDGHAVRLLGAGIRFADPDGGRQLELFEHDPRI